MKESLPHTMVLALAGSDPSGGAGIQADLKTFCTVGVYGGAVITCHTVQNTRGVLSFQPVDPTLIRQQIETVLLDIPVSHIKIGMIGTGEVAESVAAALEGFHGELICDPVLAATDGRSLLNPAALEIFNDKIVARATVLSPNLRELEILSGQACPTRQDALEAADTLLTEFNGLRVVLVKGGHFEAEAGELIDVMVRRGVGNNPRTFLAHPMVNSRNTHGTGCTMASAFTAFHLLTGNDQEAFEKTVGFMDRLVGLSASHGLGHGKGPLLHHLVRD